MIPRDPTVAVQPAVSDVGPARLKRRALFGALLAVQLIALWILGHGSPPAAGFPLDDAWIHQLVARTFAESGTLGAVIGHPLSGATSVLWPLILTLNELFFRLPAPLFSVLVNALCYIIAGQLLLLLLLRDGVKPAVAWSAAALAAIGGNHVWFAFSGMEASALIAVLLGLAIVWTSGRASIVNAVATALLLVAAVLLRPEAVAICGLVLLSAPWFGWSWRRVALVFAPVVVTVGALAVLTLGRGPSTMSGRRWMWMASGQGVDAGLFAQDLLARWAERLGRYVLGISQPDLFWVVCGLAVGGLAIAWLKRWRGLLSLCGMHAAHVAVYAALMPAEGHGGRYQPLFAVLFLPLAGLGLIEIANATLERLGRWSPRLETFAAALALAALGTPALAALQRWSKDHALAVRHINDTEVKMGSIVAGLPPDARIATYDVGGIGYFGRRQLLDLGALLDPQILPAIKSGQTDRLLLEREIDFVVVPMSYSDDFPDPWNFMQRLRLGASGRFRLRKVSMTESPPAIWAPGLEATLHCSPRQLLFRVER